jgi:endonuclease-3
MQDKQSLYQRVLEYFAQVMPEPDTELKYENPYQLVVAVLLSAQCTDVRVNQITPAFFKRFPTPEELAKASHQEVYELIKSCSYPNNKTKHLIGMARKLVEEYGGNVPEDFEDLQKLPGIGRKSANVIAAIVHKQPRIAVDTHVFRVANRIGLVDARTPLETEKQLTANIPENLRLKAHHWLILHGRYTCTARNPKCGQCGLKDVCKYYRKLQKEN